jgi:predicted outer membrane lipoprotein
MVPDWLQLGVLLAVAFALGAARLPHVPKEFQQIVALVRGVAIVWICKVVLTGAFGIAPQAHLSLAESIALFATGGAAMTGTTLPFVRAGVLERRRDARTVLLGLVLGMLTLVAGPHSLIVAAALVLSVVLLRSPWQNVGLLIPLLAGAPLLLYSARQRPAALTLAIIIMGLTVLFEIARLIWPAWNRQLMLRFKRLLPRQEANRPLAISNAAIGVALLISVLDAHQALIAGTIGLLLPTLLRIFERDLAATLGPVVANTPAQKQLEQLTRSARQAKITATVLAVLLLLALLLPGLPGERADVSAALLLTGLLSLPVLPIDIYLLSQITATAALVIL